MKTVTYVCAYQHFSGLFAIEGEAKPRRLTFGGSSHGSRGLYTTSDAKEQESIEASSRYGVTIFTHAEYEVPTPAKIAAAKVADSLATFVASKVVQTEDEGKKTDPVTSVIPEGGVVEPEAPVIPEGGVVEPEAPVIPEGGVVEPEALVIPEGEVLDPETTAPEVDTDYPDVTTVQAAAKVLRAEFKCSAESVSNKEKVLAAATAFGVTFSSLK